MSSDVAGTIRELVSATIGGAMSEWRAVEAERTKALVAEVAATVGSHLESSVRQVVGSIADLHGPHVGRSEADRLYDGVVRASEAGSVPRPLRGHGVGPDVSARSLQETIKVIPGKNIGGKFADAQATCSAVLASIKPNEVGIKIDRVIKGRNKSVRIVAGRDELDRLKPMLDSLGIDVKHVGKLNPRLMIRDIPSSVDGPQLVKDLIRQNLDGVADDVVRLVYWSPAKGNRASSAVIDVPPDVRNRLLNQGRVYLGCFSCRIADHLRILQCFKCLGFGHIAKSCQAVGDTCGHCGDGHESRACPKTGTLKCRNCENELG